MTPRDYDQTVARIAGNIASAMRLVVVDPEDCERIAALVVRLARAIVVEVKRTEPKP